MKHVINSFQNYIEFNNFYRHKLVGVFVAREFVEELVWFEEILWWVILLRALLKFTFNKTVPNQSIISIHVFIATE